MDNYNDIVLKHRRQCTAKSRCLRYDLLSSLCHPIFDPLHQLTKPVNSIKSSYSQPKNSSAFSRNLSIIRSHVREVIKSWINYEIKLYFREHILTKGRVKTLIRHLSIKIWDRRSTPHSEYNWLARTKYILPHFS